MHSSTTTTTIDNDNMIIPTNSSSTSTTTTVAKRFQCRQCSKSYNWKQDLQRHIKAVHFGIQHRCPNCKSKFTTKSPLWNHLHCSLRKPFQCDRCRKRFPERDWLAEHKVWHSEVDLDRYLQVVRHLYAYPCFYCCNYFDGCRCSHSHSCRSHPTSAIHNHNKERIG
jgi:hypothetical protein